MLCNSKVEDILISIELETNPDSRLNLKTTYDFESYTLAPSFDSYLFYKKYSKNPLANKWIFSAFFPQKYLLSHN